MNVPRSQPATTDPMDDLVYRLRHPAWSWCEAFGSNLDKEETLADLNAAANEIEEERRDNASLQEQIAFHRQARMAAEARVEELTKLKDIAAALATRPADTSSSEREVVALADKIHDACPHNLGFGNCENGPVGCAIVSKDFECVCEHVHMHAIRAARSVNPVLNALVDLHAVARVDRDEDYAAITNAAAVIEAAGSGCVAQGVKDPILTPRHFLDDILSACDASNWDADRNKGDYYRGLNDAYEVILTIAVEYQTSIYAWCKREASPVPSADRA